MLRIGNIRRLTTTSINLNPNKKLPRWENRPQYPVWGLLLERIFYGRLRLGFFVVRIDFLGLGPVKWSNNRFLFDSEGSKV